MAWPLKQWEIISNVFSTPFVHVTPCFLRSCGSLCFLIVHFVSFYYAPLLITSFKPTIKSFPLKACCLFCFKVHHSSSCGFIVSQGDYEVIHILLYHCEWFTRYLLTMSLIVSHLFHLLYIYLIVCIQCLYSLLRWKECFTGSAIFMLLWSWHSVSFFKSTFMGHFDPPPNSFLNKILTLSYCDFSHAVCLSQVFK